MRYLTSILFVFLLVFSGCKDGEAPMASDQNLYRPIALTLTEERISEQGVDFAFRLLRSVDQNLWKLDKNGLISPLSVTFALSMLANGAEGNTQSELLTGLGIEEFALKDVNSYHAKLLDKLMQSDAAVSLNMANSLWTDLGFELQPHFSGILSTDYQARTEEVNLSEAVSAINQWCSNQTNGCIKDFLDYLPAQVKMVILNALYFKGCWASPFAKTQTNSGDFHNADGTKGRVDYMQQNHAYRYAHIDHIALLSIPYGNGAFSLYVVLPDNEMTLTNCIGALDGEAWSALTARLQLYDVNLRLPKFELYRKDVLLQVLKSMGMREMFTDSADFSRISLQSLEVGEIRQAATFRIDEEGAEASAVTGNEGVLAPPMLERVEFHIDRPFLFLLAEKSTNSILFIGKVAKF